MHFSSGSVSPDPAFYKAESTIGGRMRGGGGRGGAYCFVFTIRLLLHLRHLSEDRDAFFVRERFP